VVGRRWAIPGGHITAAAVVVLEGVYRSSFKLGCERSFVLRRACLANLPEVLLLVPRSATYASSAGRFGKDSE
jgi:hypothetical protein